MSTPDKNDKPTTTSVPLDILRLSVRAYNVLRRAGIDFLGQLQSYSDEDLLGIKNLGPTMLEEIRGRQHEFSPLEMHHNFPKLPATKQILVTSHGDTGILDCHLTKRTARALDRAGIHTINDLLELSPEELMRIRNIGEVALKEIDEVLKSIDIETIEVPDVGQDEMMFFLPVAGKLILGRTLLATLPLSGRAHLYLRKAGCRTVADLYRISEDAIRAISGIKNVGYLDEILQFKRSLGVVTTQYYREKLQTLLGEYGIKDLPKDLSWHCLLILGLSWEQIENLEKSFAEQGLPPLEKIPMDSLIGEEVLEYLVRIGCPLHKIDAGRASAEKSSRMSLRSAGLRSLLDVCLLSEATLDHLLGNASDQFREDLDWYLQHLPSLDWNGEVVGHLPNPAVVWRLQQAAIDQIWVAALSDLGLDRRDLDILFERGLSTRSDAPTLGELGKQYGITRERVRQIESRAKEKAHKALRTNEMIATIELLARRIIDEQGMINCRELAETMIDIHELQEQRCEETLPQILLIAGEVKYNKILEVFVSLHIPKGLPQILYSHLYEQLHEAKVPMLETDLGKSLDSLLSKEDAEFNEQTHLWKKVLEESRDFERVEKMYWGLTKWESRVLDEIVMALREVKKPTHFKEITKLANKRLEKDRQTTVRAVHAQLAHHQDLFIRTGPGTFGLREWDPDKPVQPIKYRTLIKQVLEEAGEPVPPDEIYEKVNELRAAKESTVTMYLSMHDDFMIQEDGRYGLSTWDVNDEISTEDQLSPEFRKQLQERAKRAFANRKEGARS